MTVVLVLTSVVIMLSILLNKISERVGMPVLLAFILLGMLFGSDGLFKIRFDDFKFAEIICSTALIFIMFYGGFGTRWSAARKIAVKADLFPLTLRVNEKSSANVTGFPRGSSALQYVTLLTSKSCGLAA